MISFKIYFSEDNIRRFNSPSIPTWEDFTALLLQNFSTYYHPQTHKVQYVDNEGDKIQVSSQFEWEEMFNQLSKSQNLFKIYISEVAPNSNNNRGGDRCPRWRGGHGGGHGGWGSRGGCKKWMPYVFQGKGLRLLSEKKYKEAEDMFKEQAVLQPENPVPIYNIACAESLQGNISEALVYLNKAVDLGYKELDHILKDEDLVNIRNTEGFNVVISRLKSYFSSLGVPSPTDVPQIPTSIINLPQVTEPVVVPVVEPLYVPVPEPVVVPVVEPLHVSVPVPEPQPQGQTSRWEEHLKIFHSMGYDNDELIVSFLEKYKGNIESTAYALLESSTF